MIARIIALRLVSSRSIARCRPRLIRSGNAAKKVSIAITPGYPLASFGFLIAP